MTYAAFTSRTARYLPIIILTVLGIFLRLYKIDKAFPFDHDQEVAATTALNFLEYGKLTLIGQELSFPGFFLGPLHNWIQFIPYTLCNLRPDCVPYFYTAIGILTIIILFTVLKKIFDTKIAFVGSLIYSVSFTAIGFERGVSSNFFLTLSSIGLFICLYKYFKGQNRYLLLGGAIAGLATVNFNPIFIFSSVAFYLTSLLRKSKDLKVYIFSVFAFLINYLPLAIFNARHGNILLVGLQNFVTQNTADFGYIERLAYLTEAVVVPFYSNFLFQSTRAIFLTATIVMIILGLYSLSKSNQKFLLFAPIWMIITLVGFVFYKGAIPDYYFLQTLLPLIILISISASRSLIFLTVFLSLFLFTNLTAAQNYSTIINYGIKKQAVDYITSDARGKSFNVYYDLPVGFNTGYSYLFKAKDRTPQEGGENLYIIELKNPQEFDLKRYQSSFREKSIQVQYFGYLHVVSIKK